MFQKIGASVTTMLVAGYACIHELFDAQQAIKVVGKMNSVTILAPALGPLLGAALLYFIGWNDIFIFLAILASICLLGISRKMPETLSTKQPIKIKLITKQYLQILLNLKFVTNTTSYCCLFSGLIVWITAGPFIIVDQFGFSSLFFALFQVIIFGFFIIGSYSLKLYIIEKHINNIKHYGLPVLLVMTTITLILLYQWPHMLFALITLLCIYAFLAGLLMPLLSRNAIDASNAAMGSIVALQSTFLCSAGVLGSVLVGYLYNNTLLPIAAIIGGLVLTASLSQVMIRS